MAGQNTAMLIGGLYLAPFAGIMFLWFVAVIRDQIGEREDRFFATVFFGSGLLFVGLLFTTAAVVSTPTTLVQFLGEEPLSAESMSLLRGLVDTLLFALATRAAAVFMLATAASIRHQERRVPALVRPHRRPPRPRPARGGLVLERPAHPGPAGLGRGREPVHPPSGAHPPLTGRRAPALPGL